MAAGMGGIWRALRPGSPVKKERHLHTLSESDSRTSIVPPVEIAPDDPIIAYLLENPLPVEVDGLTLDSPALRILRSSGVKLVVPLVSQGELVGTINLGPRLSEQGYSPDDQTLLSNLAAQAAPAVRVAQLVRLQEAEAVARERMGQELRIAREIQLSLLPKELPRLPGWQIAAYYQPAHAVGGDFYDFINLQDGRLGIAVGDVADKGVPAALVMASTRAILRAAAREAKSPGQALARVNALLQPDMPRNMFVTCLYAILDPKTGRIEYANAGHNVPYRRRKSEVLEVRATGMPLGLLPELTYEERETTLEPGEMLLLYSDGLTEARNRRRQMFGVPRMTSLIKEGECGATRGDEMIDCLLSELARFTGADWEQDDDVTIVTIDRTDPESSVRSDEPVGKDIRWNRLAAFSLPSRAGEEREAMHRVAEAATEYISGQQMERLRTAVAEATLNAMEHGNRGQEDLPVNFEVLLSDRDLLVRVRDEGGGAVIPEQVDPDLEAKLAGGEPPRGWGLFLIRNMVDEVRQTSDEGHNVLEMVVHRQGGDHGR